MEETTKTDASVQVLLLPNELIEVLRKMKEESQSKEGLIFTDSKGGEALKYNAIQSSFNAGFMENHHQNKTGLNKSSNFNKIQS